jgi:hypothetical protein
VTFSPSPAFFYSFLDNFEAVKAMVYRTCGFKVEDEVAYQNALVD